MGWTSRAGRIALLLGAALLPALAGAAPGPEEGLFPGEAERRPAPAERDALSLLFPDADLFLAPAAGAGLAGGIRRYHAWKNPAGFSPRRMEEGAPRPPMRFRGWGLVLAAGEGLAAVGFGPAGGFLGAAFSPKGAMSEGFRRLLEGLPGRGAAEAADRFRVFAALHGGDPEGARAAAWRRLAEAFAGEGGGAVPAPPPARIVPGPPGPAVATKLLVVMLVIVLAGFANLALARQRRRREGEADREFARRLLRWRQRR